MGKKYPKTRGSYPRVLESPGGGVFLNPGRKEGPPPKKEYRGVLKKSPPTKAVI